MYLTDVVGDVALVTGGRFMLAKQGEKDVGYAENTNRGTCECDCARISRRLMVLIGEEMGI